MQDLKVDLCLTQTHILMYMYVANLLVRVHISLYYIHTHTHICTLTYIHVYICIQTIGAAFGAKKVSVQGESVTLGIWVGC